MNYIGSKFKLSSWIKEEITKKTNPQGAVFCDLFAGTGIIGRVFKKDVKKVISNDIEYYAYVLNRNYIGNHKNLKEKMEVIEYLNNLSLRDDGFIFNNYCSPANRLYFSDENGKKIDTIRMEIEKFKDDEDLYYFLLASLIESADKVANTASVYGAFLKKLKKSAQKEMILEPAIYEENDNEHLVTQKEANELIKEIKGDILYLDPPYNSRQYGANYHLLNTIAEYKEFEPKGKTGLRDYYKSPWCQKSRVKKEFEELVKNADFEWIFLSYNNEGLMSEEDIKEIMQKYGKYELIKKEYQRFKADSKREHKANKTYEYLHILKK
ncbi:MAG: DNA adenine methylase [Epsilonproteobacteria bacterium]|nr:DNA adenine methylase [Campylobacterota bacterium]